MSSSEELHLIVRRTIAATPERLFKAWTTPEQLLAWWGPQGVRCTLAELDLRVGGRYCLGNELPDGQVLHISGEFTRVEPFHILAYTWSLDSAEPSDTTEQVTVRFNSQDSGTEVVVVHERIRDAQARRTHESGWQGCLHGLADETEVKPINDR